MEYKQLGEIVESIFSGGTPNTKNEEFWNGDINWLSSGETRNRFITGTEKKITEAGINGSSTRLAKTNDIVIASAGQGRTRGQTSYCLIDTYINQSVLSIRANPDKVIPLFLFYNISSRYDELRAISDSHSSRGSLTIKLLEDLPISLPSIKEQRKISDLLFGIDEKIELNNLISENLEQLAQTLFKRWFVDFEFPNENGDPYKSSGGEMVESELGIIPKGWSIDDLKGLAKQVGSTINIQELKKTVPHIGLAHMPRGSIALSSWESSEEVTSNKTRFENKDILFGKLRPYFKKVGIAPINGVCSTDIIVLNSIEQQYYAYLVCLVSRDAFIDYCTATATGTRMPRTGWRQMSRYQIAKPPIEVAERFNHIIVPFYEKIVSIIHENNSLKNLRDTLLPELLSGEIELLDETEVKEDVPIS